MAYTSDSDRRAARRRSETAYRRKFKTVRVMLPPELAAAIESCESSKNGYILRLIRADLSRRGIYPHDSANAD